MTHGAVLDEFGRRLVRHRIERNWTQAELAAEAGVDERISEQIARSHRLALPLR